MVDGSTETRFFNLFRHAPTAMAVFGGEEHRVDFANEKFMAAFGNGTQDVRLKPIGEAIPDGLAMEAFLTQVYQTGQPLVVEAYPFTNYREDQPSTSYFQLSFQPVVDPEGTLEGVMLSATDITRLVRYQKGAEKEIKRNSPVQPISWEESSLHADPENFILYRVVRDVQGQPVDFEPVRTSHTVVHQSGGGAHTEEIESMRWWLPLAKADSWARRYKNVVETGEEYVEEIAIPGKEGRHKVTIARRDQDTLVTTLTEVEHQVQKKSTSGQERAGSAPLPQEVLEDTLGGIMVCEPIKGEQDEILDFRITMANQEATVLNGISTEKIIGSTLLDLFPGLKTKVVPSKRTSIFAAYCEVVRTGMPLKYELLYDLDGFEPGVWFQVYVSRLKDSIVLFITDISESKKALNEVWQQASFIQSMLDLSPSGIAHLSPMRDASGTITDFVVMAVNRASFRQVGLVPELAIGKPLSELIPAFCDTEVFTTLQRVASTGEFIQEEFVYTHKGRQLAWINLAAARHKDGLVVTFENITKAKRTEKAIIESEERLQTIIDTVQTSVGLLTPVYSDQDELVDFAFHTANLSYASAIGQRPEQVIGTRLSQWIPGYLTNGLFEAYRTCFETGESCQFDFHYDQDGFDDWVDVKATKINGYLLITGTNFTRLKQLQLRAEALVEDLRKSNDNLEQFAYVASHDLQEPLRKIQAFGDILQKKYSKQLDEGAVDIINRMQKSGGRMQTLIRDLLTYSRISSSTAKSFPVDLNRLVGDILTDMETIIQEKQAQVSLDQLPVLSGELTQLRQLFQNLLSNALKFSSPDRPLRVEVRSSLGPGSNWPGVVPPGDFQKQFALIEIRDNGIGFDPKYADRIFQVFQRLHGRSEYQGTGIGLAIVQKVAENHKGYIIAEGRPGEGATFGLLLPA